VKNMGTADRVIRLLIVVAIGAAAWLSQRNNSDHARVDSRRLPSHQSVRNVSSLHAVGAFNAKSAVITERFSPPSRFPRAHRSAGEFPWLSSNSHPRFR
jgi:hypothetical protein